jgi:hypothetical protein
MSGLRKSTELKDERIFLRFVAQLRKDFSQSGIDDSFADNMPREYPALLRALSVMVGKLSNRPDLTGRLLNRVDISEGQLRKYLDKGLSYEDTLAELIIKRTLQKVVFQLRYPGK